MWLSRVFFWNPFLLFIKKDRFKCTWLETCCFQECFFGIQLFIFYNSSFLWNVFLVILEILEIFLLTFVDMLSTEKSLTNFFNYANKNKIVTKIGEVLFSRVFFGFQLLLCFLFYHYFFRNFGYYFINIFHFFFFC